MPGQSPPPEIPPWRPEPEPIVPEPTPAPDAPTWPAHVPLVPGDQPDGDDLADRLRRHRRLLLRGPVVEPTVTALCAELMLLDGTGPDPVELWINSAGGPVHDAAALLDVMELMRAPVATRCIGQAAGTAAVVLALGTGGRSATAHARISLRVDARYRLDGRVADVERQAADLDTAVAALADRIAGATRLDADEARRALADGAVMRAADAVRDGVIDGIAEPSRTPVAPDRLRPGRRRS